jgi:pimeloyl-ACP methyl ester carboxylesterase
MTLAYDRTAGSGPPLVLIHGIGSRRGVWKPVVGLLAAERDLLRVDLPGFGDSPLLPHGEQPTVQALARAVRDWWLELGLERPHVAGNSLGGGIVLELARMDAVCSATALSPVGFWSPGEARYGRMMLRTTHFVATGRTGGGARRIVRSPAGRQATIGLMYGRPARRDPAEAVEDLVQLERAPGWEATLPISREYVFRDGAELRVPVTIGWGTRDRLLIPRQAERARALLPQARHVPLPGCGHIPMSDDPDGVAALLLAGSS